MKVENLDMIKRETFPQSVIPDSPLQIDIQSTKNQSQLVKSEGAQHKQVSNNVMILVVVIVSKSSV